MNGIAITALLAFRNLARNPRRSFLTIAAIAFALICLLVFDALKNGLHQKMVATATETDLGSLQIHAGDYGANSISLSELKRPENVLAALASLGLDNYARRLKTNGLILAGRKSAAVVLHGVVAEEEGRVTLVHRRIVSGKPPKAEREIMVGEGLARSFGVGLGDELALMTKGVAGATVTRRLEITAIFATGVAAFDQSHIFMNLPALQSLLEAGDMLSEIAVALPQPGLATKARELRDRLGSAYQVETWQEISPDLVQLISLNDTTMIILILIVFLIVAMGIANTMTTITFERFREFGTIAALGATPANLLALVIAEALALGLTASLIGSLIGGALCLYLGRHGIDLTAFTSANQYFSNNHILHAVVDWRQVVLTNCFTLLTTVLAGILPAWTAARQNPVEALGHQ